MADQYVSGNWRVRAGDEDEFIARWSALTNWTAENVPGAKSFILIREMEDPQHFISVGTWDALDSVRAWRSSPEFAEKMGRCRELCEDFRGADYELAAAHLPST